LKIKLPLLAKASVYSIKKEDVFIEESKSDSNFQEQITEDMFGTG